MATVLKDVANYVSSEDAMLNLITTQATAGQHTQSMSNTFAHIDTADSKCCYVSNAMADSMYCLAVSVKDHIGFGGCKIWI
eukprot:2884993-Ditylum_brightwellii.AAC.1